MDSDGGVRLTAKVFGVVQGVGFRYWTTRTAEDLGLTGLAENVDDGSVSVVAEGPREQVLQLLAWLQSSDAPGRVDRVDDQLSTAQGGFRGFAAR